MSRVHMCAGASLAALRSSDLMQAVGCCENIIASVYYCLSVKQWECCVCCTAWWSNGVLACVLGQWRVSG